jgi:hypothetical protein
MTVIGQNLFPLKAKLQDALCIPASPNPKWRKLQRRMHHLLAESSESNQQLTMIIDVRDNVLDGFDFLRVLVGNLHLVLFFQSHHQFDNI